jgi:protein TonB
VEVKKTEIANLENQRSQWFLLGLVVALSLLFVAFEYTTNPKSVEDNEELLEQMAQEMEMTTPDTRDMMTVQEQAPPKAVTQKLKAVENAPEQPQKIASTTSPLVVGDGEGLNKEAKVTEAVEETPAQIQDNTVYKVQTVEQLPEFPGGWTALMQWLTRNLHYPAIAQQQKIQGKVVVSFIINKDGTVTNVKLEKSVDVSLDREALRVVKMMPRWKPAIMHDKPCRCMFVIPVVFSL